jgi:malonyl-CoA/methylmalonyl-CoA synthetase
MRQLAAPTLRSWAEHLGVDPAGLNPAALRERLARGTIPQVLERASRTHPASTLSVDGVRATLAELHDSACRGATVLAAHGLSPGGRVVISAGSSLDLVTVYLAALRLGATAVLLNPAYTADETRTVLARARAGLLVTGGRNVSRADGVRALSLPDVIEQARTAPAHSGTEAHPNAAVRSDSVALLAFTSGTTGSPKAVPLTHGQLLSSIRAAMWSWRWDPSDTLVHALPLYHQHGLSGIHATLLGGSSARILSRFSPEALVKTVDQERATVLFGVPSVHQRLLELPSRQLQPLRRLRLVTSGSAPLPVSLAQRFAAATGVELLERYGLTESGLNLSNSYAGERASGHVGTPLPGVEVELADEQGNPVPPGTEGEVVLRGPQVFDGYLDDPAATGAAFWPGGWFRTGDLGRCDLAGRIRITGRLKDLVITGGMNVSPAEVEAVVEQLPEVREAAATGIPSDRWGEELSVWVVASGSGPIDAERIISHCRQHLAPYKCPKRVFQATALPRNPMGKLVRSRLVQEPSA